MPRNPSRHGTRRAAAVLIGLFAAAPAAVLADYKETYRRGIEAVDRKRWPEVARLMREAIAENAREGERIKLYGLRFEVYVPHFYLGLALVNTGDCQGAVQAFDASETAGAIRGTPRYADLLDGRKACASRLAQAATPPPASPKAAPASPPPAPPAAEAARAAEEAAARAQATRDAAALKPAAPAPPPPAASLSPAAEPPGAPPAALLRAARAYFDGRYEEALALLARPLELRGRAAAQSHLFRAAARFALFRLGREQDAALRDQAAQDVAACRRADATLRPDPQSFSPAFGDFFRRAR